MRIGFDARFLTHPQPGGFKTYTVNLVRALQEVDRESEYILYLDREPGPDERPTADNFTCRVVDGSRIGPIREQVGLRWRVAGDRLDVVHFPCNTAPLGLRTPFVLTLHDTIQVTGGEAHAGSGGDSLPRRLRGLYESRAVRAAVRAAAHVVTVSEYARGRIVQDLGVPFERVSVTLEAADPAFRVLPPDVRDRSRRRLGERYGIRGRFVLGVGYEPRKRVPLLMRAFARCADRHRDARLVIVAASVGFHADLRALADVLGISDRVVVLGGLSADEMLELYNLADLFVFPSSREGFGLPPLEAMSCGTPTIARRACSIPEVTGDAARLIDGDAPDVWADAIADVLGNPVLREELAALGLARAASFSWRRCAEQTVAIYRAVAARAPRRLGPAA